MGRKKRTDNLPVPVRHALTTLGRNLSSARRRRRIPMEILAERASISRSTLSRIERGDPGVAMGSYAKVLFALGLITRFAEIADVRSDELGLELGEEDLPQRVRRPRQRTAPATPKDKT